MYALRQRLPLLLLAGLCLLPVARADQTVSYPPSHPTIRFSLADGWTFTQGKDANETLSAHANSSPQTELFVTRVAGTYPDKASCVAMLRQSATGMMSAPGYSETKFGVSGTQDNGAIPLHYLLFGYKYGDDTFTAVYLACTAPGGKETYIFLRRVTNRDADRFSADFKLVSTTLQPIK